MMNRLKLLFLSLLTPLFCLGVSFGAWLNWTYITQWNPCYWNGIQLDLSNFDFACVVPTAWQSFFWVQSIDIYDMNTYDNLFWVMWNSIDTLYQFCFKTNRSSLASLTYQTNSQWNQFCQNWQYHMLSYEVYWYSVACWWNSSCESDLEYLSWKYASLDSAYNSLSTSYSALSWNYANCLEAKWILSWQLATCNSDLASCTNSCDSLVSQCQLDKNACLESYNTCTWDLQSMTNYSDSLSTQLNECLAELPVPCEWTWCDEIVSWLNVVFSFFWENEWNMFSLPIWNNVFLPQWYRAYVDSWVVAIAEINKRKIKIDEWSDVVNETYYSFIMWIIMLLIFSLFAYYMKKFISKFFIPKETKW